MLWMDSNVMVDRDEAVKRVFPNTIQKLLR